MCDLGSMNWMSTIGKWKTEFSQILMISLDWDVYRESARLFVNHFPKYATRLTTSPDSSRSLLWRFFKQQPTSKNQSLIYHKYKATYKCTITWNFFFSSEITWNYIEIWHNVRQHTMYSLDERSIDQMCILSLKVTFQEISLRKTCIMNVLEEWELGNI